MCKVRSSGDSDADLESSNWAGFNSHEITRQERWSISQKVTWMAEVVKGTEARDHWHWSYDTVAHRCTLRLSQQLINTSRAVRRTQIKGLQKSMAE